MQTPAVLRMQQSQLQYLPEGTEHAAIFSMHVERPSAMRNMLLMGSACPRHDAT